MALQGQQAVGRAGWKRKTAADYTVVWFCATMQEEDAALAILDEEHKDPDLAAYSDTYYRYGALNADEGSRVHNLIIVRPLTSGKVSMTKAASHIKQNFPNISHSFFVGIAGGLQPLPQNERRDAIYRGDVVVAQASNDDTPAVLQYDYADYHDQNNFKPKHRDDAPAPNLQSLFQKWHTDWRRGITGAQDILNRLIDSHRTFAPPDASMDVLFEPFDQHVGDAGDCSRCRAEFAGRYRARQAQKQGNCYPIRIHCGLVVTGDSLIKDPKLKESIKSQAWGRNALCVDMESAVLMDEFHPLIIRGISDYADSHYGWDWTEYAAATAAAVAKDIISRIRHTAPPSARAQENCFSPEELRQSPASIQVGDVRGRMNLIGSDIKNSSFDMSSRR